jgi:hypothetical protein
LPCPAHRPPRVPHAPPASRRTAFNRQWDPPCAALPCPAHRGLMSCRPEVPPLPLAPPPPRLDDGLAPPSLRPLAPTFPYAYASIHRRDFVRLVNVLLTRSTAHTDAASLHRRLAPSHHPASGRAKPPFAPSGTVESSHGRRIQHPPLTSRKLNCPREPSAPG